MSIPNPPDSVHIHALVLNQQMSATLGEAVDANTEGDRGRTGLYLSALAGQIADQRALLTGGRS